MTIQGQTAIRGVFSVGLINIASRVVGYGKHVLIAAWIGFTADLDAFYMALSILYLAIFTFGDVFDTLGVPRLVSTLQSEGEESFRELAGSILAFTAILTGILCAILLVAAPWLPWIAPGFSPEKRDLILRTLAFLSPLALIYLPYHALGSFLRARRRFLDFHIGELFATLVTFVIIAVWPKFKYVFPVSISVGFCVAFIYMLSVSRVEFRFPERIWNERIREIAGLMVRLLPLYFIGYLFTVVDRTFATFLPTGGVSALTYAWLIVLIPSSILVIDNVFIIPLAETSEKGPLLRQILNGVMIISIPFTIFSVVHSHSIVKIALERGAFTSASTGMTGDALMYLGLAIPSTFINPVLYRMFQVLGRFRAVSVAAITAVFLNVVLNYTFMRMGLGIRGLALATSISYYALSLGGGIILYRLGIPVFRIEILSVFSLSTGVSIAALSLTYLIPLGAETLGGLLLRGLVFVIVTVILYWIIPYREIRHWRNTVARELMPASWSKR